ncbi:hypothetical protein [Nitratireductor pacificus]|uniref:Type IV pilus assembly PilZ n=1 Tax=Nitratireductor pacificus pht-3B TaxID=391937 RepID=K2MJH0_9HYPH|nr:hypothetical protein [Nitratireductor pacificus]EKF20860.1 type IV pilus assembly PilZ [Nitratireductor pacificus pht-3B]
MMAITEKSIGLDSKVFPERRGALRRRVLKGARLRWKDGFCTLAGTMRDQSETGARIRFGDICAVPADFMLEIAGGGKPRRARIRWRSLTEIGVTFEG